MSGAEFVTAVWCLVVTAIMVGSLFAIGVSGIDDDRTK